LRRIISGITITLLLTIMLELTCNIHPVGASKTIYIRPDGSIDPPTAPIGTIDNNTYTFTGDIFDSIVVERSNIIVDGNGYMLQGNGSGIGFHLSGINNVTIMRTNVRGFLTGVYLNSSSNTIVGNDILNNYYGVWLNSSSNMFCLNNFINNVQQVNVTTSGCVNSWYSSYPSGGNYWSDYNGSDSYGGPYQNMSGWFDFIGDTPYYIDENNTDRYPLVLPFDFMWDWYMETGCVFRVIGDSMEPTILHNDLIVVRNTTDPSEIQAGPKGDIVVHRDPDNSSIYIVRRAMKKWEKNGTWHFTVKSDNRPWEVNITMSLIIGKVANLLRRFNVTIDGVTFHPTIFTNSTLGTLTFNMATERLSFNVTGLLTDATTSSCGVFIPRTIFTEILDVKIDDLSISFTEIDYGAVSFVSFETFKTSYTASIIGQAPNGYPVHNLDTGLNYTTIQAAIDTSETLDGHTIFVEEGTYYEHVVAYKSLSLIGENRSNTIIDGGGTGVVIEITASNTNVTGFTVQNGSSGIMAHRADNINILNNVVVHNRWIGIYLYDSNNNTINGNDASHNENSGISSEFSNNNTILENRVADNKYGIYLRSSDNNQITDCNIADNEYGVYSESSNNNIINNNTVENNGPGTGIELSGAKNTVQNNILTKNWNYGITMSGNNNVAFNNTLTDHVIAGIYLHGTGSNNVICGNSVAFGMFGVYGYLLGRDSEQAHNNTICGNLFVHNEYGIYVYYHSWYLKECYNNIVINNTVTDNDYGIHFYDLNQNSYNNSISHNIITDNGYGIYLDGSYRNIIEENFVETNDWTGIYISNSKDNLIVRNNVTENVFGMRLEYSSNNSIYHNNFIYNTIQASNYPEDRINRWDNDYPSGGNCWSDYTGEDLYRGPYQNETGSDGIGDTPYSILANNTDNYPLMNPWIPRIQGDIDGDGDVDHKDLLLLASAYGSEVGDPNYIPEADIDCSGKVDHKDLLILAANYGKET
jgi:parallel beta-helix repeat protein